MRMEKQKQKFNWEDWYFVLRMCFIVGALQAGLLIQTILYPDVAYIVRDAVASLFRSFDFSVIKRNSTKGIGISFNDYGYSTPTDVDVVHGLMSSGCIVVSPFLALATDYLFHNLKKFIEEDGVSVQTGFKILLKEFVILGLFLPFTFFRFVIILLVFLFLWNSPLWPIHYTIGHDLIGNIVLILGIILVYCYLMYLDYWKTQGKTIFNIIRRSVLEIKRRIFTLIARRRYSN